MGLFVCDRVGKTVAGGAGNLAQIIVYQYKTLIYSQTFNVLRNFNDSGAPAVFQPWVNTLILTREAQFSPSIYQNLLLLPHLNSTISSFGY